LIQGQDRPFAESLLDRLRRRTGRPVGGIMTIRRIPAILVKTAALAGCACGMLWAVAAVLTATQVAGCKNAGEVEKQRRANAETAARPRKTTAQAEQAVDWSQTGSATKKYTFVLDDVRYDADNNVMGHFTFSHHFTTPLRLYGFGFPQSSQFQTRFEEFRREESGRWADVPVGYCGTGAETYELKPGTEYVLLIPLWPFVDKGNKGQVGVPGEHVTIVSEPFPTDRIQQTWKSRPSARSPRESANNEPPQSPATPDHLR
jgi:hypothetical protein